MRLMRSTIRLLRQSAASKPRYHNNIGSLTRSFSTTTSHDVPVFQNFSFTPPDKFTVELACGVADATQFYIRYGIANQRLRTLAKEDIPTLLKWQKMMEVFLTTQVQVISGLGYSADEQGLTKYASDLAEFIVSSDDTMKELLGDVRRDTWRELVAACFGLDVDDIPSLSVIDARNIMHKVSSKMIEPSTLLEIQQKTAKIEDSDPDLEIAKKHQVLQDVLINTVYLGGNPSLTEEAGFGSGPQAYAKLQCAMTDHETDPLVAQYASSAMVRIWQAAGLDLSQEGTEQ